MIPLHECLLAPVMTERSMAAMANGTYLFVVSKEATKPDVKKAIEELFSVKVNKVHILNRVGKKRIFRRKEGKTSATKIAYVTVKEGSINFEGGI